MSLKRFRSSSPSPSSDSQILKKARTLPGIPSAEVTLPTVYEKPTSEECSTTSYSNDSGTYPITKPPTNICAVTNSCENGVELVYIIPKDASAEMLDDLEFAWGLERNSLDVHDSRNLVPLTRDLKESFETGLWALLPTDQDIVRGLSHYACDYDCSNIENVFDIYKDRSDALFSYEFIPLPGFQSPIMRQFKHTSDATDTPSVTYNHPYGDFPTLLLPVYPHFAIVNLASKIARLTRDQYMEVVRWFLRNKIMAGGQFGRVKDIYIRWLPTKEFDNEYSNLPPLNRKLNCLVHQDDSFSRASTVSVTSSGSDGDSDVDSENAQSDAIKFGDFSEPHALFLFRIITWKHRVLDALGGEPDKCGPPPTIPVDSSTPATRSSGESENDIGVSY